MSAIRELVATLLDVRENGDLMGHLAEWWQVVTHRELLDDCAA